MLYEVITTVNFILAWMIYVFMSGFYGDTTVSTESIKDGYLIENNALQEVGIKTGDNILSVNGVKYDNLADLSYSFISAKEAVIDRNGETMKISFPQDFAGKLTNSNGQPRITSYNVCYTKLLRIVSPF